MPVVLKYKLSLACKLQMPDEREYSLKATSDFVVKNRCTVRWGDWDRENPRETRKLPQVLTEPVWLKEKVEKSS